MTTPETDTDAVTLINVFEVAAENLEPFLARWRERAELMSNQPGFRSLRLHRALSREARFQVINVAEWDSAEALHAAVSQQGWLEKAEQAVDELDFSATPAIYRVTLEISAR
jgi:heme-degrading monooxygenase HmoA